MWSRLTAVLANAWRWLKIGIRVALVAAVFCVPQYYSWITTGDPYAACYIFLFSMFLSLRILEWPAASWWGGHKVVKARNAWGCRSFDRSYDQHEHISALIYFFGARAYFAAMVHQENTEKMCNQYQDALTLRILTAGAAGFLLAFQDLHHGGIQMTGPYSDMVKALGILLPAGLPLMWDYSRFERQRIWNREVREPQG